MTDLTLKMSDDNLKKLKAYTILSGHDIKEIEQKLSDIVSSALGDLLSSGIADSLVAMDGRPPAKLVAQEDPPVVKDEPTGNELSDEDSPEEVKALNEEELPEDEAFKLDIRAKDAGNNADAYVDAVIAQDRINRPGRSAPRKSFDPRSPRVSIGEYTGEETLTDFGI